MPTWSVSIFNTNECIPFAEGKSVWTWQVDSVLVTYSCLKCWLQIFPLCFHHQNCFWNNGNQDLFREIIYLHYKMFSGGNCPASVASRSLDHSKWRMFGVYQRTRTKSLIHRKTGFNFHCIRLPAGSLHLAAADLLPVLSFAALQYVYTCKVNSGYWEPQFKHGKYSWDWKCFWKHSEILKCAYCFCKLPLLEI